MLEAAIAGSLARSDRPIVITGATGWVGRATLDLLAHALGPGFDGRVSCFGSSRRAIDLEDGRSIIQRPLAELATLTARDAWVLHLAFLTKDRAETMTEAAYRAANDAITATVLGALDRIDAAAVFVASSGAVTKADDPAASPAMRLYGAMKRDDETRFAAWAEACGRRAVIGRLYNLSGPHINKPEAYAVASFIRDAQAGRPIAVRAPRAVIRSYVAIRELMSLVFALMGDADAGVVRFDSGGEPLELGDVAHAVAATLGGEVVRAAITEALPDRYVGDGAAYAALLARFRIAAVGLDRQITETAGSIKFGIDSVQHTGQDPGG